MKLNIKQNKKFNNIRNTIKTNQLNINTDKWFKNLTDKNIPKNVIETVSLGQKFNPPCELNDHLVVNVIKQLENLIPNKKLPEDTANEIRNQLLNKISQHRNKTNHTDLTDKIVENKI